MGKGESKTSKPKPIGKVEDCPDFESLSNGKPSGREYAVWSTLVEDWVEDALANNHPETTLYTKIMSKTPLSLKKEFIGTHQHKDLRTRISLLEFYRKKFEQDRSLQAEQDKKSFTSYKRGNTKLKDARQKWEELRAIALAGGELIENVRTD